jgi:putative hydrolase of the HAD superfamily
MFSEMLKPYIFPLSPIPTNVKNEGILKEPVSAVFFDIYGTLFISSSGDISLSQKNSSGSKQLAELLHNFNINMPVENVIKSFFDTIQKEHKKQKTDGVDFPEVEVDLIWKQLLKLDSISSAREFAIRYEMIVNPVYPMPGLDEVLSHLKIKNKMLGIISNAQFYTPVLFDFFCGSFPEQLGFDPDFIFYSFEHGYAKPSKYLFQEAKKIITQKGLEPQEVLYIGNDMLNDIYPATTVQFQTCLFAGDRRSLRLRREEPECTDLKSDIIINDLKQLILHIT